MILDRVHAALHDARLRLTLLTASLAWLAAAGCTTAHSEDRRAKALYGNCLACHGADGAGNRAYGAPAIAGLDAWYVASQLATFRTRTRGAHPQDAEGLRMGPMARTLTSTRDIRLVAEYLAGLPPATPIRTVAGSADRGRSQFQACSACHGPRAEGNEALSAPPLAGADDWYVAGQLAKFRAGIRGGGRTDGPGARMRAMALALPDDQAVRDVAVYVSSLR